ncbi:unnamed protein product [Amaranthus hypochondriacus]
MEKQLNYGRKPPTVPKKLPKERVFGANTVHLSEDDANNIIGGIVEKGISDSDHFTTPPSSTPLPSLLPFPVARHRSHGPHWTPSVNQFAAGGHGIDRDEEYGEDDDPTNYEPIAFFAEPVIKKKKKELDLSRWRELIQSNGVSYIHEKEKECKEEVGVEKQNGSNLPSLQESSEVAVSTSTIIRTVNMDSDRLNESLSSKSNGNVARLGHDLSRNNKGNSEVLIGGAESTEVQNEVHLERSSDDDVDMGETLSSLDMLGLRDKQPSAVFGPTSTGHEKGNTSLESEIDAENRALLERMSKEEIAEAQADIRNRINPELLKILKKRGFKKSEKLGSSCSSDATDVRTSGIMEVDKHLDKDEDVSAVGTSVIPSLITHSKVDIESRVDEGVQSELSKGSIVWDLWSERVEAARAIRFSFDGNVVEGSNLDPGYAADAVGERDYLRTEGDPGADGYTIKEALALARSVIPGQRGLALRLLASVLSKALHNICDNQLDCSINLRNVKNFVDWEAIWAYALGPEPELVLSLRLALDDNHSSVVLASAKAIQCILAYDVNENFFNILEKRGMKDQYTAPVFRSRPDIKHGFISGGFWKYSTKPSNILLPDEEIVNSKNEERTIQDDNVVAGQDVAAGLVRMGILPRLCYLLETEPAMALEECILSILIAIARHSSTCASAIWNCERLVQTIVNNFTVKNTLEHQTSKIKSVTLLRVLAQSSKTTCMEFIEKGFFQTVMWQLYRVTNSIDEWIRFGTQKCKLASELMVEQLRFWKVCVMSGHCISSFTGFFPGLCIWLNPPTFEKLMEANVFNDFASISVEVFLVLEALASRLPDLHSRRNENEQFRGSFGDNLETWCWSDVRPMVDVALKWLEIKADSTFSKLLCKQNIVDGNFVNYYHVSSLLWILSAVLHMLNTVLIKATPRDVFELNGNESGRQLPDFVAKLVSQIIKNGILNIFEDNLDDSFVDKLCQFRHQSDSEVSIASVCCLHGLLQVVVSADHLIHLIGGNIQHKNLGYEFVGETNTLDNNIFKYSLNEWKKVFEEFMKFINSEWKIVCSIEVFGRGGPAPGVGVGWGASGGGFWSLTTALVQADARMFIELLRAFHSLSSGDFPQVEEHNFMVQSVNSAVALSLAAGPGDETIIQNVLDFLLEIPVLKFLNQCIFKFCHSCKGVEPFTIHYTESDLVQFGKSLASHFRDRWLSSKKKKNPEKKEGKTRGIKRVKPSGNSLDTIPEDMETPGKSSNSQMVEWARQRLPLPVHWPLSPIMTIGDIKSSNTSNTSEISPVPDPMGFHEVAKAGLFLLLGFEAMSSELSDEDNFPVKSIPLIWKLHALSVPLLVGMSVLEEERSRYTYGALQNLYGKLLDELWLRSTSDGVETESSSYADRLSVGCLRFQSEIHDSYSTFIETLVEQFAAISYGDMIFGRQIAIYLHRQVEISVRLATWNALSNAHALELLPSLDDCLSQAEGYLEPVEEDEGILNAYVKSWISGSLDRAATRNSMTYAIVLHHLSSFIFNNSDGEKLLLRNKLVKSLLRDYARKQHHEDMISDLVRYQRSHALKKPGQNVSTSLSMNYTDARFERLKDCCEGNSQLFTVVEKLKSCISKKQSNV